MPKASLKRHEFRTNARQLRKKLHGADCCGAFLLGFDIAASAKGASQSGLSLHSKTIQAISK